MEHKGSLSHFNILCSKFTLHRYIYRILVKSGISFGRYSSAYRWLCTMMRREYVGALIRARALFVGLRIFKAKTAIRFCRKF